MKPHKWHKEIKAWADGAEIEWRTNNGSMHTEWRDVGVKPNWDVVIAEFRIKPQPKEPQYLYVYRGINGIFLDTQIFAHSVIGKIKLEQDDGCTTISS